MRLQFFCVDPGWIDIAIEGIDVLGTVYPNYPSFSDNYLLSRVIPEVPAGKRVGWRMCETCLPLPIQQCLLVAMQ